jgi:hypothetical protein
MLLDKHEIHEVLLRYCRGVDRMDKELIASVFHPDAIDDHGGDPMVGTGIADGLAEARRSAGLDDVTHRIANALIEVEGDTAYSEAYFISSSTIQRDGRPYLRTRAGRYIDRFERRNDEWKIAHRVVVDDWSRLDEATERAEGTLTRPGRVAPDDPSYVLFAEWRADRRAARDSD